MKLIIALAVTLMSASAFAGSVNMTCEKAQATYDSTGRLYVDTKHAKRLPIYGLVQECPIGYDESPYFVQATDTKSCFIGYRCYRQVRTNR